MERVPIREPAARVSSSESPVRERSVGASLTLFTPMVKVLSKTRPPASVLRMVTEYDEADS